MSIDLLFALNSFFFLKKKCYDTQRDEKWIIGIIWALKLINSDLSKVLYGGFKKYVGS